MTRVVTSPPEQTTPRTGSRIAGWWEDAELPDRIRCGLCPRGCTLRDGDRGFCFVRENRGGNLVSSTYGLSTGFCIDPIEKKPLFHFFPGTPVLSFGTAGCNLGCKFCQNWTTTRSKDVAAISETASPEAIAETAERMKCRSVAFTYNDPIVWAEYAIDTAVACRRRGIKTVAVTSGYISPVARRAFFEPMDAANVDLKGFGDEFYRNFTGGALEPVLNTLRWIAQHSQTWLEITNLIIPQANDSLDDIRRMCDWIAKELGPDVPLHFSAFHPSFKLQDRGPTPPETLIAAYDVARQAGLRYVYTGNVVDYLRQATYCPGCQKPVVQRDGYLLSQYQIRGGCCGQCGTKIAGHFDDTPGNWGDRRLPLRVIEPVVAPRAPSAIARRPDLSAEQKERIFAAAGHRVIATVLRQKPAESMRASLSDAAEIPLYGSFVSLKRGGQLRACCGHMGQDVPLAETLGHSAERAAKDDPRFQPIAPGELSQLDMDVWLLWGLQPVAARGPQRIAAITIGRHGVQIARGSARGLLLPGVAVEHHLDAAAFLEQVCLKAGLPPDAWLDDDTMLMTFEGEAIHGPLGSLGQEKETRPPAVAGMFYPGSAEEIASTLDAMFESLPEQAVVPWPAALLPHAGWVYSGRLAARVLTRIQIPRQVILFCPKHRPGGAEWAVAPYSQWNFPGGTLAGDPDLARQLAQKVTGLSLDATPHEQEHAIEVELPLLARVASAVRVVGITIGGGRLDALQRFAKELAEVLGSMPERPLLLVSSDMNHFADEVETRRLDCLALEAIASLDPAGLFATVEANRISMCGMRPAVIVMETLRQLGLLTRCEIVDSTTSAAASGDTRRVVGYAGVLLG